MIVTSPSFLQKVVSIKLVSFFCFPIAHSNTLHHLFLGFTSCFSNSPNVLCQRTSSWKKTLYSFVWYVIRICIQGCEGIRFDICWSSWKRFGLHCDSKESASIASLLLHSFLPQQHFVHIMLWSMWSSYVLLLVCGWVELMMLLKTLTMFANSISCCCKPYLPSNDLVFCYGLWVLNFVYNGNG